MDSTKQSQTPITTRTSRAANTRSHWLSPPPGWVKCNSDAAHREGSQASAMGWLIRNQQGTLLEARTGKFEGRSTVMESELSALLWSMQACCSLGYSKVILRG